MKKIILLTSLFFILRFSIFAKKFNVIVDIHKLAHNFPSNEYSLETTGISLTISKGNNLLIISFLDSESFISYKRKTIENLKKSGYFKITEEEESIGYKDGNDNFAILKNDNSANIQYFMLGTKEYIIRESTLDLKKFLDCTDIDI